MTWAEVEPFPGNPVYQGRLDQLSRRWGGYMPSLVGNPLIVDNSALAFPEFPADAKIIADGNHRRALAERDNMLDDEFLADFRRGLSRKDIHFIRRGLNDRRTVKPAEDFIERAEENPLGIEATIKKEYEAIGWHISRERERYGLACPKEILSLRAADRKAHILAALTYEKASGPESNTVQAAIIKGLGLFWVRYPKADMERLAKTAKRWPEQRKLYEAGVQNKDLVPYIKSSHEGIRYALATVYNRGLRGRNVLAT